MNSFLQKLTKTINKLIRGSQKFNNMTADQLVARPTYAEEFQNIRENVHKVVLSSLDQDYVDAQKMSQFKRAKTSRNLDPGNELKQDPSCPLIPTTSQDMEPSFGQNLKQR